MVDPRAYQAMNQPVLGIRDAYFLQLVGEIRDGLRYVFGTANQATFPIPASGSGAMEAAVANFFCRAPSSPSSQRVFSQSESLRWAGDMARTWYAPTKNGAKFSLKVRRKNLFPREAGHCRVCAGRDIDGRLSIGPRHCSGSEAPWSDGDWRHCYLARSNAGGTG